MHLLNALNTHPSLKGRWVLKGGTALNLFVLRHPRLSVDIDLNYIGALEREEMLEERPRIDVFENWVATTFARLVEHAASQVPDKYPASQKSHLFPGRRTDMSGNPSESRTQGSDESGQRIRATGSYRWPNRDGHSVQIP